MASTQQLVCLSLLLVALIVSAPIIWIIARRTGICCQPEKVEMKFADVTSGQVSRLDIPASPLCSILEGREFINHEIMSMSRNECQEMCAQNNCMGLHYFEAEESCHLFTAKQDNIGHFSVLCKESDDSEEMMTISGASAAGQGRISAHVSSTATVGGEGVSHIEAAHGEGTIEDVVLGATEKAKLRLQSIRERMAEFRAESVERIYKFREKGRGVFMHE